MGKPERKQTMMIHSDYEDRKQKKTGEKYIMRSLMIYTLQQCTLD
jgi:hypothetical protein